MSTGPRAWTDEIDGSSSFTVLTGIRLREQGIDVEEDSGRNLRVYTQDNRALGRADLTSNAMSQLAGATARCDIAECATMRVPSPLVSTLFADRQGRG